MIAAIDLAALIGEHLQLRPKGREHVGLCPFHDDSRPSLNVITHKDPSFYKCFSCGASGTAIDFMMDFHKMSFPEALQALAERAGVQLSTTIVDSDEGARRADLLRATDAATLWYRRRLLDEEVGRNAREVLQERGIGEAVSEQFKLGVAPDEWDGLARRIADLDQHARVGDRTPIPFEAFVETALVRPRREHEGHYDTFRNRLIFPISDELGRPIAFGGRSIAPEDEPKYLNSPENPLFDKSRTLYAFHLAKKSILDEGHAIVVEGYTDAIACHQAGISNVVATLGTALTPQHARRLERLCSRVTLVFDGDAAGQRAADRAVEVFFRSKIDLAICTLPGGADPDGLLREPDGEPRFRDALADSKDVLDHLVGGFRQAYSAADGVSSRQRTINEMLDRLSSLGFDAIDGVRRHLVLDRIASLTGMPEQDLMRALSARRRTPRGAPEATTPPEDRGGERTQTSLEDTQATTISRRHKEAERRVLALFVSDPEFARMNVDAGEGTMLPASELCPAQQFLDPLHRKLAEHLLSAIESGESPQVGQLLLQIEEDEVAQLATDLYRLGEDLIANSEAEPRSLLGTLCSDLHQIAQLERFESTAPTSTTSDPGAELKRHIEQLRTRGADKAAMAQVPRPRRPMRIAAVGPQRRRDNR